MKNLWLARLARPELSKVICELATKVQDWSRNDDRKTQRLMGYLKATSNHRLEGVVGDAADKLQLTLFVDADFCGDSGSTKSTTGGGSY